MMQMSIHIELNYSRVFDIRSQLLGVQIRSFSSTKSLSGDPVKADSHRFNTQTCDTHFFVPQSGTNNRPNVPPFQKMSSVTGDPTGWEVQLLPGSHAEVGLLGAFHPTAFQM